MHLFDANGTLKKYSQPEEILEEFYTVRLNLYIKRREYLLNQLQRALNHLKNRVKFLSLVASGELRIGNRCQEDIVVDLQQFGLSQEGEQPSYNYLLNIPILSITREKLQLMISESEERVQELAKLRETDAKDVWKEELLALRKEIEQTFVSQQVSWKNS